MKIYFRIALCAILMAMCATVAQAQGNNAQERMNREQLAETQAKHISHELALDAATSKRFIDTYVAYQKEVWALGPRLHQGRNQQSSDADAEQAITQRMERSQKILDLRKKYYNVYRQFLTPTQIERVYELERKAMKRLARHRNGNDGHRGTRNHRRK